MTGKPRKTVLPYEVTIKYCKTCGTPINDVRVVPNPNTPRGYTLGITRPSTYCSKECTYFSRKYSGKRAKDVREPKNHAGDNSGNQE